MNHPAPVDRHLSRNDDPAAGRYVPGWVGWLAVATAAALGVLAAVLHTSVH